MQDFRFSFQDVDGQQPQHFTQHEVDGWKSYGVTYGRSTEYGSVVKGYTNSWQFIKADAEWLLDIIRRYGVNRRVKFIVERCVDHLNEIWQVEFVGLCDFTQFVVNADGVSLPIVEAGFFRDMENKYSLDFDTPMEETLVFNGAEIKQTQKYIMTKDDEEDDNRERISNLILAENEGDYPTKSRRWLALGLEFEEGKTEFYKKQTFKILEWDASKQIAKNIEAGNTFFYNEKKVHFDNVKVKWDIKDIVSGHLSAQFSYTLYLFAIPKVTLDRNDKGNDYKVHLTDTTHPRGLYRRFLVGNTSLLSRWAGTTSQDMQFSGEAVVPLNISGEYYFSLILILGAGGSEYTYHNITSADVEFDFHFTPNTIKRVKVVRIEDVFANLVNSINTDGYNVQVDTSTMRKMIDGVNTNKLHVLTSAGGIRNTEQDITLTTSLSKFLDFVYKVYNYKMAVEYNRNTDTYHVSLRPFEYFYPNTQIADVRVLNEFEIYPLREKFFTAIEVGYTTKDDAINGAQEYNDMKTFTTPNTQIEENVWDVVSPYSAAVFDIETKIWELRGEAEKVSQKDNDIFVLEVEEEDANPLVGEFVNRMSVHPIPYPFISPAANVVYHDPDPNPHFSPLPPLSQYSMYVFDCVEDVVDFVLFGGQPIETLQVTRSEPFFEYSARISNLQLHNYIVANKVFYCRDDHRDGSIYHSFFPYDINVQELAAAIANRPTLRLRKGAQITAGIEHGDTMYNIFFTPKRVLQRHQKELNSYFNFNEGDAVSFHIAERNAELIADGVVENAPLPITSDICFRPLLLSLSAAAKETLLANFENNRLGYFEFDYNGKTYKGHLASEADALNYNPMNVEPSELTLIAHKDTTL